jgi:hypothetical protein
MAQGMVRCNIHDASQYHEFVMIAMVMQFAR